MIKKYLKATGFVLIFLLVYYIVQTSVAGAYGIYYVVKEFASGGLFLNQNEVTNGIMGRINVILIACVLISFAFYAFICKIRNQNIFKVCRFNGASMWSMVLSAVSGMSISIIFAGIFTRIPIDELFPDYNDMIGSLIGGESFIVTVISTGLLVPFIEEVIFRGLVFSELKKCMPVAASAIVQAVLFGVYHLNLLQGMYAFLIGLVLGFVCIKAGSIWPAIILHAGVNTTSTVMSRVVTAEMMYNYGIVLAAAGLLVLAASLVLLQRAEDNRRMVSNTMV